MLFHKKELRWCLKKYTWPNHNYRSAMFCRQRNLSVEFGHEMDKPRKLQNKSSHKSNNNTLAQNEHAKFDRANSILKFKDLRKGWTWKPENVFILFHLNLERFSK